MCVCVCVCQRFCFSGSDNCVAHPFFPLPLHYLSKCFLSEGRRRARRIPAQRCSVERHCEGCHVWMDEHCSLLCTNFPKLNVDLRLFYYCVKCTHSHVFLMNLEQNIINHVQDFENDDLAEYFLCRSCTRLKCMC